MRRRTPEQIEALNHEDLSNWQIFKMSLVCGGIYEVSAPDGSSRIQRLIFWIANLDSTDRTGPEKAVIYSVIGLFILVPSAILNSLPDMAGTPEWSRYIPAAVLVSGVLSLLFVPRIILLRAGGAELVVEAYKKRKLSRAGARRSFTPGSSGGRYS